MNIAERYVSSYIVECLTGIAGVDQERVYEVLRASDYKMSHPVLDLAYNMARENPESQEVKDSVAGLIFGYTVTVNQFLADAISETIEEEVQKKTEKKEAEDKRKAMVTLSYSKNGSEHLCVIWFDLRPVSTLIVPSEKLDYVLERFHVRFPDGKVIDADQN